MFLFRFCYSKWGVPEIHVICVIGSKTGIQTLLKEHPDIIVTIGMIDDVNEEGCLVPGLGDSGDRLFGIKHSGFGGGNSAVNDDDDDDEALLHPSRRKRTYSQQIE